MTLTCQPTGIMDEGEKDGLLTLGRLEEQGHVPEGDEEEGAGAHRVEVDPGVDEIVCEEDFGGGGGVWACLHRHWHVF